MLEHPSVLVFIKLKLGTAFALHELCLFPQPSEYTMRFGNEALYVGALAGF